MATTVSKEYADGDGYFQIQFLMIRAHESLLLGFESVMSQTKDDHSKDMNNWLGYVSAWASCVHYHHSLEEEVLFPFFESKGFNIHTEVEQHAKLHADLDSLNENLDKWKKDKSQYSNENLKSILNDLEPNFRQHLQEEVEHLSRENLCDLMTSQDLKDRIAALMEEGKKGNPFIDPVFMMSHTPPEHKYWSNMGWFMYKVVIPLLSYRHSGYWKYSPEPLNL